MPIDLPDRIANQRTYRLTFGLALSLWFTNAFNWPASFVAAIVVAMILAMPLPAPPLKLTLVIYLKILAALLLGLVVVWPLKMYPVAGLVFIFLGLFLAFFYVGIGRVSGLTVMLAIIGFAVVPSIGANSVDAAVAMAGGMALALAFVPLFLWIAHAVFPEIPMPRQGAKAADKTPPEKKKPPSSVIAHFALRPVIIVAPVFFFILSTPNGSDYIAMLIKAATLAAQANVASTTKACKEMIVSTVIGGLIALGIWELTRMWPSLTWYVLLHVIAALFVGRKIFKGPGLTPSASMWSYALVTALIINGPAVFGSGFTGEPSGMRSWMRIAQFLFVSVYASGAVYVFDYFWQKKQRKQASQSS